MQLKNKESISGFDIILNLCNSSYFAFDEELADCVLKESLDDFSAHDPQVDFYDFQKYLYIASEISVTATPESEQVLHFYLEALKNRSIDSSLIYNISFKKLIHVAAAHAKLCLRNSILIDDSVVRYFKNIFT